MKTVKSLLCTLALLSIVGWGPFSYNDVPSQLVDQNVQSIQRQASNLDPKVLKLSVNAYKKAQRKGMHVKQYLTIIDFTKPSTERRLWVVDLKHGKVLYNTWVAHGKNSGNIMATSFSNTHGSLKSSIGVYVTRDSYVGGKGYALRLHGLERGINDNAYSRKVVMHGAWYVSSRRHGYLGRSWGCPAVDPQIVRPLINTIKGNSLLVAYYPDKNWLRKSTFLTS